MSKIPLEIFCENKLALIIVLYIYFNSVFYCLEASMADQLGPGLAGAPDCVSPSKPCT